MIALRSDPDDGNDCRGHHGSGTPIIGPKILPSESDGSGPAPMGPLES